MNNPKAKNQEQQKQVEGIPLLSQENATESNAIQIPQISLPKGCGALKGIDEKFEVNSTYAVYWKITTRNNVATIFDRSLSARVVDPTDSSKNFQSMPEFSYDDKSNWFKYKYKEENLDNVPHSIEEKDLLNGLAPITNQYLKRIKYGNHKAYYADPCKPYDSHPPADVDKSFYELVIDFGEHVEEKNKLSKNN